MFVSGRARLICLATPLIGTLLILPASAPAQTTTKAGTVVSVDPTHHQISVTTEQTFSVVGDSAEGKLGTLATGDRVEFKATDKAEAPASDIQKKNYIVDVPWLVRVATGLIVLGLAMILAYAIAKLSCGKGLWAYVIGVDNRLSNSQTQLVLWGATVFVVYLTTVTLRIYYGSGDFPDTIGGVGIPTNLLALSGLSALTFGAARAVTVSKDAAGRTANAADPNAPPAPVKKLALNPSFLDLFRTDEKQVDLGDTQMILITAIAIVIYTLKSFYFLGHIELAPSIMLPDVDTTLLAGFGVGQGAYLAKKAASDPGKG